MKEKKVFIRPAGDENVLLKKEDTYVKAFVPKSGKKRKAFSTLLTLYNGNRGKLGFALVMSIIKSTPPMFYSLVIANIINAIAYRPENYISVVILNVSLLLIGYLLNLPLDWLFAKYSSIAIRGVEANLRSSLIRKIHMLTMGHFKKLETGRVQSKVMRDVEAITDLSHQLLINAVHTLYMFLVAVTVTLIKNPIVFLSFILLVPIDVTLMRLFRKKLVDNNKKYREELENTSASVIESMELMPVTKAHGLEAIQAARMDGFFEQVATDGYRLDRTNAFFQRCMWFTMVSMQVVCLIINIILALKGKILIGDITLFQTYFQNIVGTVNGMINMLPMISKGMESVNSVGDVLLAEEIEDNSGKTTPENIEGNVVFQNVHFKYDDGDTDVLKGFTLDVRAGETVAFVGSSGCGKTTAVNLVIGFGRASKGAVLIDGQNINDFNLRKYRSKLAVVPQTPILFRGTIRDNITYGYDNIPESEVVRAVEQANLKEFVDSLPEGLDTLVGEHGGNLSGGQRQRIAIARAFIRNPSIVILDEATSALDTVSERKIQTAINNVAKDRTTFIVAHRLSTIRNADRIAVIDEGRITELGTFEELMEQKGFFYKLQTMQNE